MHPHIRWSQFLAHQVGVFFGHSVVSFLCPPGGRIFWTIAWAVIGAKKWAQKCDRPLGKKTGPQEQGSTVHPQTGGPIFLPTRWAHFLDHRCLRRCGTFCVWAASVLVAWVVCRVIGFAFVFGRFFRFAGGLGPPGPGPGPCAVGAWFCSWGRRGFAGREVGVAVWGWGLGLDWVFGLGVWGWGLGLCLGFGLRLGVGVVVGVYVWVWACGVGLGLSLGWGSMACCQRGGVGACR